MNDDLDLVNFSGYVDPSCYDAAPSSPQKPSLLARFAARVKPAPQVKPRSSLSANQRDSADMDFPPPF